MTADSKLRRAGVRIPSLRPGLWFWTGVWAFALAAGVRADGIRVLLAETSEPVRVAGVLVAAGSEGLESEGRSLGRVWQVAGEGPHRVADLQVRGAVRVERTETGLRVVNRVGLEDYVHGTLGREIYPSWADATLRAQAVVIRSYALYQRARNADRPFDVEAGTRHQVYGGIAAEGSRVREAVAATRGEILTYRGEPILAAFHSASGGQTASAEEVWGEAVPYLVSLEVPNEEDSPDTYWRASTSGSKLGRSLAPLGLELGVIREARVVERSASGRATRIALRGSKGSGRAEARALRTALGPSIIRSTLFEIRDTQDGFVFVGSGHGHGVGLSQWGAQTMAERGASYREILETFYPGTRLEASPL